MDQSPHKPSLFMLLSSQRLIDAIKEAPNTANLNCSEYCDKSTAFEIALQNSACKYDTIRLLLENNFNPNLVTSNFKLPVRALYNQFQQTKDLKLLPLIELAISKRPPFSIALVKEYAATCIANMSPSTDESSIAYNHKIIAHFASRLCGTNIGKLLTSKGAADVYITQLEDYHSQMNKEKGDIISNYISNKDDQAKLTTLAVWRNGVAMNRGHLFLTANWWL